ncbi:MAG: excinuclease ABC subunit B [Candidatus Levybacteria bacterium RIFCSPLOWO2_01_FULL_42_15]|nr:MAG: excinuclease ABC subunit B [Candidatus Levybacteria bacterium RIFCSPLOWO2_01_FULL_42_15]
MKFKLVSNFKPTGDQPQAVKKLTQGITHALKHQVLLGVTGSGKTFTVANVIQNIQKPTLVISHNKTLAGQLYQELRDFFPKNAVCYFVSYYDYYQPEAYIPQTDTYIEKESQINEEIDRLRLSATANLLTRSDTIVVASVSCIYNLGSPVEFGKFVLELKYGMKITQESILARLTDLQYDRNDYDFKRGTFRVRGEGMDILPAYSDNGLHLELKNNCLMSIEEFDPLTGETTKSIDAIVVYPSKHYMTDPKTYTSVFAQIRKDTEEQCKKLTEGGKLVEAQRLAQRTTYDLNMIREVGYVNGIENYSRYFDNRKQGDPPYTLIDYLETCSKDWLVVIDESHITLPQLRGMYNGDKSRKQTLIDYGFRLPSALDNRPLRFEEFMRRINQAIYVSATPDEYEISLAQENASKKNPAIIEQLIRPTGLIDPVISIKQTKGQIGDLIKEIQKRVRKKERVLITTLTKRMAEDLTAYLQEKNLKITYLHSDIKTLDRQDILDNLRSGEHDVIVGINLLREGLDLPEVSLVVILDADKEGFLRSKTSLIQTMGRAARHMNAEVIMYADVITKSMKGAIEEVERRRAVQLQYNQKHNITPFSIKKQIRAKLIEKDDADIRENANLIAELESKDVLLPDQREKLIKKLRAHMKQAAVELDFETAALLRDKIRLVSTNA